MGDYLHPPLHFLIALCSGEGFIDCSSVKQGLTSLIGVGLQTVLGDTTMEESEQVQTFITMEHNAIIRVDTKVWRYNFSDKSIIGSAQDALC